MDSQETKQTRLPLQLILGIAIGGIVTAAIVVGVSSLTRDKGSFSDDGRSLATNGGFRRCSQQRRQYWYLAIKGIRRRRTLGDYLETPR